MMLLRKRCRGISHSQSNKGVKNGNNDNINNDNINTKYGTSESAIISKVTYS